MSIAHVWSVKNDSLETFTVAVGPWAEFIACDPQEELMIEAFDFETSPNDRPVFLVERYPEWINVWVRDDANIRVLKNGVLVRQMGY